MRKFMNKKLHILLIVSLLAISLINTSCKTKKTITRASLREFTATRLIKEVEKHEFSFDYLQAKMNLKIETNDKSFGAKGQLRMKKDSIIWISVSLPLGLEIIRLKISQDSVYFLNRTEKTYLTEDINIFSDISPMITSVGFIQSLIIGNDINLRESDNYRVEIKDNQYNMLITHKLRKSIRQSDEEWKVMMKDLWIDPQIFRITKYNIKEFNDNKRKIDIKYADFEEVNERFIPTKIIISVHGDFTLKAVITLSNISTSKDLDFLFNIPKKYDRIFK